MLVPRAVLPTPSVPLRLPPRRRTYPPKSFPVISFYRPPPSNPFGIISFQRACGEGAVPSSFVLSPFPATHPRPPVGPRMLRLSGYLLMSSFASRRFSSGWRNGFVASGAALIACVISLAAVGKSTKCARAPGGSPNDSHPSSALAGTARKRAWRFPFVAGRARKHRAGRQWLCRRR